MLQEVLKDYEGLLKEEALAWTRSFRNLYPSEDENHLVQEMSI